MNFLSQNQGENPKFSLNSGDSINRKVGDLDAGRALCTAMGQLLSNRFIDLILCCIVAMANVSTK